MSLNIFIILTLVNLWIICYPLTVTALISNETTGEETIPESYLNYTVGNQLWTNLIKNCKKPTFSCVETNMYNYLSKSFEYPSDFEWTDYLKFRKNSVDFERMKRNYELPENESNVLNDTDTENEPIGALEEMSRALNEKTVKFLMTHDMEVHLPEIFFHGAVMKVSPRSLEDNGALIKLELLPKTSSAVSEPRIFKKIKKFITDRLLYALLAILLVIKLLAAKFMFLMPMMIGAVAAKKLLIKVLLFLFPVLKHIFKLCPYVPHGVKFHHHKHQIAHIHHIGDHHHHGPPHFGSTHHGHGHHGGVEVIAPHADGPPSLHHYDHDHEPPHKPSYNPHEQELEYYAGGPALSHHFSTHREDGAVENEIPWGQGKSPPKSGRPLTPTEIENMVLKAEKEALIKARLQQEKQRIQEENLRLQEQLKQALRLQEKLKQQTVAVKSKVSQTLNPSIIGPGLVPPPPPPPSPVMPSFSGSLRTPLTKPNGQFSAKLPNQYLSPTSTIQIGTQQVPKNQIVQEIQRVGQTQITQKPIEPVQNQPQKPQQQQVQQQEPNKKPQAAEKSFEEAIYQAATITYDPFYSPILEKIDKILTGLGFNDEPCKERLVCSMYKNPTQFSPHSNLLSAELSRDPTELQKPTTTNAAVVRFYRYVQAARDGQDKRDCLRLYANCSLITE